MPRSALALQSWRSLERGVCGEATVGAKELRAATKVCTSVPAPLVTWFWEVVEGFRCG